MDIGTLLPRHARYRGDHPALIVGGRQLSCRALNAYVNQLANALLGAGLRKGDKLATVLPNCLELMAAYWAAAKSGLVIVPMSPLLQEGGLVSLLTDSDAALVLGHVSFAAVFERIRDRLPLIARDRWVLVGDAAERAGFRAYEHFIDGASRENPPDAGLTDGDM
jgi:acyl-CoA synthetase (AMP-forming)/AMP-acid ligase II